MDRHARFRINAPDVISETIDGETIILHLGTGFYFSVGGSGARAWPLLCAGSSIGDVADSLAGVYDAPEDEIVEAIQGFVSRLREDHLLVPTNGEASSAPAQPLVPLQVRSAFEAPTVAKYTDMEDLLLLDPVHEVSADRGWPHGAPSNGALT